ncbi:MAG: alpha/beta fold hydrolase [Dehalococcoidales bacterium]|nr:alpha/beta fold hydrolase [Dehalococcoidales bacterium]
MPKVKAGDINIYYEVHGEGEPLVFINGAGATIEGARMLIPVYSPEYRLVLFDNRGAGQSDKPDVPYTIEMMAGDLAGLLDAIGIDSAHIRGISMGGMIAQEFTLRYPKRVGSLILASTYCGGPHSIPMDAYTMRLIDMEQMQKLTPEERVKEILRLGMTQEFIDKNPGFFQQMEEFLMENARQFIMATSKQLPAVLNHDTYEQLPEIKSPTLVIAGDADQMIQTENSRILASRIPGAELVIFPNTGHMLIEAGDEVNKITLDFLRRHRVTKQG